MTTAYSGDGITFPDNTVQATAPRVGMVNRIINGDMRIDQRNAGASVSVLNGLYLADRFRTLFTGSSTATIQQSTTAPVGFVNSIIYTITSGGSSTSLQQAGIWQRLEGANCSDFAWGTASATTVTLSFWVRSSLTGTYCVYLKNSGNTRSYVDTYSITSANTWEKKTITIAGDTSGTWLTDNGIGITLGWDLKSGTSWETTAGSWASGTYNSTTAQVDFVGTTGATWQITGVQLEKGSTATDFEYVDYGRQLQMCQRYFYYSQYGGMGAASTSQDLFMMIPLPTVMRTTPDVALKSGAIKVSDLYASGYGTSTATPVVMQSSTGPVSVTVSVRTGWSPGLNVARPLFFATTTSPSADGAFLMSAEL